MRLLVCWSWICSWLCTYRNNTSACSLLVTKHLPVYWSWQCIYLGSDRYWAFAGVCSVHNHAYSLYVIHGRLYSTLQWNLPHCDWWYRAKRELGNCFIETCMWRAAFNIAGIFTLKNSHKATNGADSLILSKNAKMPFMTKKQRNDLPPGFSPLLYCRLDLTLEACATWLCSHTFSMGLILEPWEGWIETSSMLTPR